jgi:hypothetical protein
MPKTPALALILAAMAASAAAQTPIASVRHGYAWPTDRSPAADALPRAMPPTEAGWNHDLDLPPVDAYQDEVLRYVRTGLKPTLVVQLAVVATGRPVQVMVEQAVDKEHLRTATRAFGQLPWDEFLKLKGAALAAMTDLPAEPDPLLAGGPVIVDAVDQLCTLEYAGLDLSVRRRLSCGAPGSLQDASDALVEAAQHAAGPAQGDPQR